MMSIRMHNEIMSNINEVDPSEKEKNYKIAWYLEI